MASRQRSRAACQAAKVNGMPLVDAIAVQLEVVLLPAPLIAKWERADEGGFLHSALVALVTVVGAIVVIAFPADAKDGHIKGRLPPRARSRNHRLSAAP